MLRGIRQIFRGRDRHTDDELFQSLLTWKTVSQQNMYPTPQAIRAVHDARHFAKEGSAEYDRRMTIQWGQRWMQDSRMNNFNEDTEEGQLQWLARRGWVGIGEGQPGEEVIRRRTPQEIRDIEANLRPGVHWKPSSFGHYNLALFRNLLDPASSAATEAASIARGLATPPEQRARAVLEAEEAERAAAAAARAAREAERAARALAQEVRERERQRLGKTVLDEQELEKMKKDGDGLWEGFSRGQLQDINNMFKTKEDIINTSLCPVCNVIVKREDGCMFIRNHNCQDVNLLYNKTLYNSYLINNHIYWCTICGRIANEHRHLEIRPIDNPPKLTDYAESTGNGSIYGSDCKWQGGGGLSEKISRLQRFREFLLKSQEDVGKKTRKQVWDELIEQTWNAPFTVSKNVVNKILTNKKWNFSNNAFPLETARLGPITTTANQIAPDIPYTGDMPTNGGTGYNATTLNDNVQLFEFHHKQPDNSVQDHKISKDGLTEQVKANINNGFFRCFNYSEGCKAKIYPQEIKEIVDPELYERYRRLFNVKFQGETIGGYKKLQRGGYEQLPIIVEGEFSQCTLPTKNNKNNSTNITEGGRRRKTHRKNRRNKRSTNKKRK